VTISLKDRFKRVEDVLIGVWRFRNHNKVKSWCATYQVRGNYYDTYPCKTLESALDKTFKNYKGMRRYYAKIKSKS